jgi:hypothetical protein
MNFVASGIKKYGTKDYFLILKEKSKGAGMTAQEWDWYRARQKEWEPDVLAAEMKEAERKISMDRARKLSIKDLRDLLEERMAGVAEQSGAGAPETSVRCGAPAANKTVS